MKVSIYGLLTACVYTRLKIAWRTNHGFEWHLGVLTKLTQKCNSSTKIFLLLEHTLIGMAARPNFEFSNKNDLAFSHQFHNHMELRLLGEFAKIYRKFHRWQVHRPPSMKKMCPKTNIFSKCFLLFTSHPSQVSLKSMILPFTLTLIWCTHSFLKWRKSMLFSVTQASFYSKLFENYSHGQKRWAFHLFIISCFMI